MATKKTTSKKTTSKKTTKTITVKVPTPKEVKDAAKLLRGGHPAGGRIEAEQKKALSKKPKKKTT